MSWAGTLELEFSGNEYAKVTLVFAGSIDLKPAGLQSKALTALMNRDVVGSYLTS